MKYIIALVIVSLSGIFAYQLFWIDRLYHSVLAQYDTVLIGLVLAYEQAGTSAAFWPTYAFNALTVGLGEAVACYGLGGLLLWRLDKSNALQRYLQNR